MALHHKCHESEETNMKKWYHIFPKNTGLSLYTWIIFCILPFYFIFKSSSKLEIIVGILMICLFFTAYRLSFISSSKFVYVWVGLKMAISIFMTLIYGYVYFSLFLAFFIGNIQNKIGFITMYIIHLLSTITAMTVVFFVDIELFLPQFPFIIISIFGVILLPINIYNRNKREQLENLLDDANEKLAKFAIIEERERIARDLHDTLGQKLSLIGLKSDLANKLMLQHPEKARKEITDIHVTARTALKEVRQMVSEMRRIKLDEELVRIHQMLTAAQVKVVIKDNGRPVNLPILNENVLSMCLKEAVTNVVKHSEANTCYITLQETPEDFFIEVKDNGKGMSGKNGYLEGHGIRGMKERLEFLNGKLSIHTDDGTTLRMTIPNVILKPDMEEFN